MLFKSVLVSIFLLALTALAVPPLPHSQSQILKDLKRSTGPFPDSGAVLEKGTFESVNATITIPHVKGPVGSDGHAYIAIDGFTCKNVMLRAGFVFNITDHGHQYLAWAQWYPEELTTLDIDIYPGNRIQIFVGAMTSMTSVVTVTNLSTGKDAFKIFGSLTPLCMRDASWLVEKAIQGPLPNFGEVVFEDAVATGNGKTHKPKGAHLIDMTQDNKVLVKAWVHESTVTIKYE